jgi:hypothetical protein
MWVIDSGPWKCHLWCSPTSDCGGRCCWTWPTSAQVLLFQQWVHGELLLWGIVKSHYVKLIGKINLPWNGIFLVMEIRRRRLKSTCWQRKHLLIGHGETSSYINNKFKENIHKTHASVSTSWISLDMSSDRTPRQFCKAKPGVGIAASHAARRITPLQTTNRPAAAKQLFSVSAGDW